MLLSGQNSCQTYGKLVSWDEDADAFQVMLSGKGRQPGEGLVVLEIQERYLTFLVKCVELLLPDIEALAAVQSETAASIVPPFLDSTSYHELKSLAEAYAEAPYRVPQPFEFEHVQQLVTAKKSEAADHVWALREDPSYFQEMLSTFSEHRQERILSINGKKHPRLETDAFWNFLANEMVVDAYGEFILWNSVEDIVKEIEIIRDREVGEVAKETTLSKAYNDKLYELQFFMERMAQGPVQNVKTSATSSPQLRHQWAREPQQPGTTRITTILRNLRDRLEDPLIAMLVNIMDEQQSFLLGMPNIIDEIDRLLRTEKSQSERVSVRLVDILSGLAAIAEITRCLQLHMPSIQVEDDEVRNQKYDKRTTLFKNVYQVFAGKKAELHDIVTPMSNFDYPSSRKRTERNQEQMRAAEAMLDHFWLRVDLHCQKAAGETLHGMLEGILEKQELERTPPWQASEKVKPKPVAPRAQDQYSVKELKKRTEKTLKIEDNQEQPRAKTKTRGHSSSSKQTVLAQPDVLDLAPQQRPFEVDRRAYKCIKALFHSPAHDPSGETPWRDLQYTLTSLGFENRTSYGSARLFTPIWVCIISN